MVDVRSNAGRETSILRMSAQDHVRLLWAHRMVIGACFILAAIIGVVVALVLPPYYESNAVLQPRERNAQPILGLAGLGGEAGAQLNRLEVLLKSRDLAMDVAASHPELVRRLLSSLWDDKAGNWKRGEPPMLEQGGAMQAALEVKSNLRKNLLLLAVQAKDPVLAKEILDAYIERLNVRVLQAIIQDADSNRVHLERRLAETHDPEVQSRMLSIMASEFARSQLVFNRVFEVIEKPILLDQKKGPRRKNIVVVATMLGILAGLLFSYLRPVRAMILDFLGSSRD